MRALRARTDALLALAIGVELELECWLGQGISTSHRIAGTVATVLLVVPIAVRRRWPAEALVLSAAAAAIPPLVTSTSGLGIMLALAVLAYSTGAWLELRRALVALALACGSFGGLVFLAESHRSGAIGKALFFLIVAFSVPWAIGRLARERARRAAAFAELATQAAAEHEERARAAIAEERVRIGSELQDIIAHSVSAIVIQAGGARQLVRTDPDRARASILTVEQTGREALADLRRLLGVLRKDDDPRALAPQPGLDQLASLADSMRAAGLDCELRTEGEPVWRTPGVDLVGYRVVEAVLACTLRHGGRNAVVTLRQGRERIELEISGDRPPFDLDEELRGIAERVALYDGSLRMLPGPGTEFALRARLPVAAGGPA